ncbi:MAG: hypothetical protein L6R38_006718 [Xanthoria sp. 2 TBL-2021]|nr:MAG: hypothetical protein L6R38_006718 [Xanthoria sp. 2 TBL-2021]
MKFITTITALAALLPIITLAVASPADSDDVVALEGSVPTGTSNSAAPNNTAAVEGIDYDDTTPNEAALHENDLAERRVTKQSDLTISVYRNQGCSGPRMDVKVRYDTGYTFPIQSYRTSRTLKPGETLSLFAKTGNNRCGRETSHTPPRMGKGCHGLGGASVGGASCFKLWRHMGFIY